MDPLTTSTAMLLAVAGVSTLAFIIKTTIKNTVKSAIQHGFDRELESLKQQNQTALEKIKLENQKTIEELKSLLANENTERIEYLKREIQIKDRSAKIAELIAEWLTYPEEQKTLNTLTIEAFLWLPDDILQMLSQVLSHSPTAPNIREVLAKVRQHLITESNLDPKEFIIFQQETTRKIIHHHRKQD
jgi:predicted membrane chloride channel (bestrophin family)